jgi:hypothetical protein
MIVSVSRRCDIPAFGSDGFMEWLRRGSAEVRNPFRPDRPKRVSLKKQDVDALVFWSRDPRPLLAHLPEIESGGYPYYFLLTVTGYPRLLEPSTPRSEEAAGFFEELSGRIGRRRVMWRYDPVIFTAHSDFDFHVRNFFGLADLLAPFTSRVIVSFFDPYPKLGTRLKKAGIDMQVASGSPARQAELLAHFAAAASRAGIEIQSCAEAALAAGVCHGKCVDEKLLHELFGLDIPYRKDPGQRKLCLCQQSVDIGSYGTCRHGCLYCYAC